MAKVIINGEAVDIDRAKPYRPAPMSASERAELMRHIQKLADETAAAPKTLDAAVNSVLKALTAEAAAKIRGLKEEELISLHFTIGMGVRAHLCLWGNDELVRACGESDPDEASGRILHEVWKRLRAA